MKKIGLGLLSLLLILELIGIFVVGGMPGAYTWCLAVFIIGPLFTAAAVVQIIVLAVRLIRKKKVIWNLSYLILSLAIAFPITVLVGISPVKYPRKADSKDAVTVMAPVENGELHGGPDFKSHAYWPSECYAFDIVRQPAGVNSENLSDYGIYGADIVAPIAGTVIGVENNEPDIRPNSEQYTSLTGNYIYLEIDETHTYLILAHFKKGSINVKVGDHVEQGQLLGQVGNSGTSSEPHLHIGHQRNNPLTVIHPACSESLPIIFK